MSGTIAPIQELTPDNHGPIVSVVAYILVFTSIVVAITRLYITVRHRLDFAWDDAAYVTASGFAIAQSVVSERAVHNGLGRHMDTLTSGKINTYYKLLYTAGLLAIIAMIFAKLSVILLFRRLAPQERTWHCIILCSSVAVWGIFSIFAVAFQCKTPQPWVFTKSNCPTWGNLYYPVIALNIVTDAILSIFILPTVWKLNMAKSTRLTVMALFGARVSVCGVAIGQLIVTAQTMHHPDQTRYAVKRIALDLIVTHLSSITSAIPRIHGFLSDLQTGRIGTMITEHEFELTRGQKGSKNSSNPSHNNSGRRQSFSHQNSVRPTATRTTTNLTSSDSMSHLRSGTRFTSPAEPALKLTPDTQSGISSRIYSASGKPRDESFNSNPRTPNGAVTTHSTDEIEDDSSTSSLKKHGGVVQKREFRIDVEYRDTCYGDEKRSDWESSMSGIS
ncbi:hypothetical protein M501DRAFT_1001575 [Patellaria atrata CBS 101060]|uniref:Rhodopsin domain-containing protein n=1 Tax=Patellaria atrata CBS 101060 TaxID=1346257 RepID=A0A9P4SD85_9PEZI|nr:hypothetical protein M501DRAFT_1001575 [Patellaria atrata CBS 101060]